METSKNPVFSFSLPYLKGIKEKVRVRGFKSRITSTSYSGLFLAEEGIFKDALIILFKYCSWRVL